MRFALEQPPTIGNHLDKMGKPLDHIGKALDHIGKALDDRLDERLGLSRRALAALCAAGRVRAIAAGERSGRAILDGRPRLSDTIRLVVLEPGVDPRVLAEDLPLGVLFDDDALLLVDKPAGMPTLPGVGHPAGTLANALRGLLVREGGALSAVEGPLRPGIVHRLDIGTSGVLAIARTDGSHRALADQFRAHTIERRYLAVVRGEPSWDELTVESRLARRRAGRRAFASVTPDRPSAESKHALTFLRVLRRHAGLALVEARPATGRTHQIRVHLAESGHPLIGDTEYGGAEARHIAHRLGLVRPALHARELGLRHPSTDLPIAARAPIPPDLARTGFFLASDPW